MNPLAVALSASMGILATAGINQAWELELWNPWDLMNAALDRHWTAGARTLIFLAALCWLFSVVGINYLNVTAFGADSTMLLPRYLTIPRGQLMVILVAWAVCPWQILASATAFSKFLSGYSMFMAGVVAIMVAECK